MPLPAEPDAGAGQLCPDPGEIYTLTCETAEPRELQVICREGRIYRCGLDGAIAVYDRISDVPVYLNVEPDASGNEEIGSGGRLHSVAKAYNLGHTAFCKNLLIAESGGAAHLWESGTKKAAERGRSGRKI